jgi:predicted transcriptional regulator
MEEAHADHLIRRVRDQRRLPGPAACQQIREQSGLSQDDIARAVGVTRAAVARWEAGERQPRPANLRRYVELLEKLAAEAVRS